MPNRIIRDACRTSPSLAALSDLAERTFWRVIVTLDDFGRYHGSQLALLAAAYPVPPQDLTPERFAAAMAELEAGDLIRRYESGGRKYIYSPTWQTYQRLRARRSQFPEPQCSLGRGHRAATRQPSAAGVGVGVGVGVGGGGGGGGGGGTDPAAQPLAGRSDPRALPRDPAKTTAPKQPGANTARDARFEEFWLAYPKSSRLGKVEALKAWCALDPSAETVSQIMRSLAAWTKSRQWSKDGGEFIPWPQKFLRRGRWREVPEPATLAADSWRPPEERAAAGDYSTGLAGMFRPAAKPEPAR